jgi:hypothetical protein
MSASDLIKAYLQQDIVSEDVNDVLASNPIWSSASEVPDYAYKSLKDIWVGSTASSGFFANSIVASLAMNKQAASSYIQIGCLPVESTRAPKEAYNSNEAGAETAEVIIAFCRPPTSTTQSIIEQAELRVRYLIDKVWRNQRREIQAIPYDLSVEKTIGSNLLCQFIEYSNELEAVQIGAKYFVSYTRIVPV